MNTRELFNKQVEAINKVNAWNSPLEILGLFIDLRNTISSLQDELIQESLDSLKVKENN